jgi:hypothetical protein
MTQALYAHMFNKRKRKKKRKINLKKNNKGSKANIIDCHDLDSTTKLKVTLPNNGYLGNLKPRPRLQLYKMLTKMILWLQDLVHVQPNPLSLMVRPTLLVNLGPAKNLWIA